MNSSIPIVWSIAGSDSSGGAGIQVDLKVMNAFGVHGCSVLTALTAQNTRGVLAVESVSKQMFQAQLMALKTDLPPLAIKLGMLGNVQIVHLLADFLKAISPAPYIVCDPVLKSTSGTDLLDPEALSILKTEIFPLVDVLTPNLPETEHFLGHPIETIEASAEQVLTMGVRSVLIKGGHGDGQTCSDYWTDGSQSLWLSSPRIDTPDTHGTGCILSSAIASALALGQPLPQALTSAKTFLDQSLKLPTHLGQGVGPMQIQTF